MPKLGAGVMVYTQGTCSTASELLVYMPQHSYKISLHAARSATKIALMRRDFNHNPQKYLSNTPGGVHASAFQPPDPHWKAFLFLFSSWDVVNLFTHWVVQNTKRTLFKTQTEGNLSPSDNDSNNILIHAGSVHTICAFFFSFLLLRRKQKCLTFDQIKHKMQNNAMVLTLPAWIRN